MATVRLEREGDVGVVVIDAPPLNLFGEELTRDLIAALDEVARDLPRALLVRAEGEVFTGGADVHVFQGKTPAEASAFFEELSPSPTGSRTCRSPRCRRSTVCASRPASSCRSPAT